MIEIGIYVLAFSSARTQIMISKSHTFFGVVSTADEGTEVDVCEEAAIWAEVLLISPVLFIQSESLLPHIRSCVADCGPT